MSTFISITTKPQFGGRAAWQKQRQRSSERKKFQSAKSLLRGIVNLEPCGRECALCPGPPPSRQPELRPCHHRLLIPLSPLPSGVCTGGHEEGLDCGWPVRKGRCCSGHGEEVSGQSVGWENHVQDLCVGWQRLRGTCRVHCRSEDGHQQGRGGMPESLADWPWRTQSPWSTMTCYMASLKQHCTQSNGHRPFGISALIVGFNFGGIFRLYQTDPQGHTMPGKPMP